LIDLLTGKPIAAGTIMTMDPPNLDQFENSSKIASKTPWHAYPPCANIHLVAKEIHSTERTATKQEAIEMR